MDFTLEIFWIEYTDFDNKNGLFYVDKFIWKSKDICLSVGLASKVPKFTHYWVVLFHPRA